MNKRSRFLSLAGALALSASSMASQFMPWSVESSDNQFGFASWTERAAIVRANDCGGDSDCGHHDGCDDCCDSIGNWWDNTELFLGGDAYANIGDFPTGGFGNSFGVVSGFNTGFGLGNSRIRGQFGASYGFYDFKGRGSGLEADSLEEQIFLTGGIYKRADLDIDDPFSWGIVYDGFVSDNWGTNANEVELGQIRTIGGYALNECNELGVWGAFHASEDIALLGRPGVPGGRSTVRTMNYANVYWKHNWQFGADTMAYVGAMDPADVGDWVIGFTGRAPLSHSAALYGGFQYVTPSVNTGPVGDTEDAWNAFFGIVFFPGGKAVSPTVAGQPGLPLLPVANNSTLLITD